jgi:hypothetical protein
MLFSERYFLRQALLKKADMNRVRDLFAARDAIKAFDAPEPILTCYICEQTFCDHEYCCEEAYDNTDARYCPCCGELIWEDDGDC